MVFQPSAAPGNLATVPPGHTFSPCPRTHGAVPSLYDDS